MSTETDVRDFLERLVAEEPVPLFDPGPPLRRARRRLVRNLAGGAMAVAVAVGVLLGGASLLRSTPAVPAGPTGPSPQPIPPLLHNGPLSMIGLFSGVTQIELDGAPGERLVECRDLGGSCTETGAAAWSTDGTRLAYSAQCAGGCGTAGDPIHGIRVLDVRTGSDTLILPGEAFSAIDWSPDGSRLAIAAWTRYEDGDFVEDGRLRIIAVDGSAPEFVVPGALGVESISWSPDGTRIAYGTKDGHTFLAGKMFVVASDGSSRVALGAGWYPAFSPDGTRLAYGVSGDRCEIWTMAPDGSDRTRIVSLDARDGCGVNQLQPGPEWSPDGRQVAFMFGRSIWIVGADGTGLHELRVPRSQGGGVSGFAWRPIP